MPVRINVADNTYAQRVYNELKAPKGLQPDISVAEQQQDIAGGEERPADGLLTRTLQRICREKGAESAGQLQGTYVTRTVNLELDHSDEVDGGASTSKMDDDWVDVDFTSDLLTGPEKKEESADQVAQRTMAALEDVTVDQIVAEYGGLVEDKVGNTAKKIALLKALKEGEGDSVGGKITAAIKAQEKFRKELLVLRDKLVGGRNESAARAIEIEAKRADSCAKALKGLVTQIVLKGGEAVLGPGAADKTVVDALSHKMLSKEDRTKREATEKAVRILDEQLADLGEAYASLAGKTGEQVSMEELVQLEQGLAEAKNVLAGAKGGIVLLNAQTGETQTLEGFDKSVLRKLKARINEMSANVAHLRTDALNASIKEVYDAFPFDLLDSPIFSDAYIEKVYKGKSHESLDRAKAAVETLRNDLTDLKTALDECRRGGDATHARQVAERIVSANYGRNLRSYILESGLSPAEKTEICERLSFIKSVEPTRHEKGSLKTLIGRFEDMVKKASDMEQTFIDGGLLARVLDGTCRFATAVSAGAWGADAKLLEEGVEDRNLVHCRMLGHGTYNKVDLCTYRMENGTTVRRVFKPELPARRGLSQYAAQNPGFGERLPLQKVAQANVNVRRVAEKLGVGNSAVGAHLGVHDGRFGLMMDVAEGVTGLRLIGFRDTPPKNPEKVMVGKKSLQDLKDILSQNDENAKKLAGNLRHAFADLGWLDYITGQFDRNAGNYLIFVDDDLSVRVTGIDNDMCFPEGSEGIDTCPSAISQDTYDKLEELAEALEGQEPAEARRILSEKLGIDDLTDQQLDGMVRRIQAAFEAASSETCEKIPADGDWLNIDKMGEWSRANARGRRKASDLFMYHVVGLHMQPFEVNGGPLERLKDPAEQAILSQDRRLKAILSSQEAVERMIEAAKTADPAVSEAELKAFFSMLQTRTRKDVIRRLNKKNAFELDWGVETELVKICSEQKKRLLKNLGDVYLPAADQHVQGFLPQCFRHLDQPRDERQFFNGLAAVLRRNPPLSEDQLAWLADGGAIELAPFIRELLLEFTQAYREDVDGGLIAEALVSELAGMHDEPDEAEVGRLRRLVVNKLNVTPSEVPGMPATLGAEDMVLFRKACALTPAGKDYYANVKAKYDALKG